jgi:hypothetical protein
MRIRLTSRAGSLAATAVVALSLSTATAVAASKTTKLPAKTGKIHRCHTVLYKVSGRLPVTTDFTAIKGAHPKQALFSCANADKVAKAGKRFYDKPPFHTGKKVTVDGVTYTMGSAVTLGGQPSSGPIYGWTGGGVVIYMINPTGA